MLHGFNSGYFTRFCIGPHNLRGFSAQSSIKNGTCWTSFSIRFTNGVCKHLTASPMRRRKPFTLGLFRTHAQLSTFWRFGKLWFPIALSLCAVFSLTKAGKPKWEECHSGGAGEVLIGISVKSSPVLGTQTTQNNTP